MSDTSFKKETGIDREGVVKGSRIVPLLLLAAALLVFLAVGIEWSPRAYPMFSADGNDFKDVGKLVTRLRYPDVNDHLSKFVWSQFSKETQKALSVDKLPPDLQKNLLIPELNKIVDSGYSISSDELFAKDVRDSVGARGRHLDVAGRNRLLLESAYKDEINPGELDELSGKDWGDAFKEIYQDIPVFIKSQIWTVWVLGLCSLIPGIAGLIYRRAFWKWFLATFAILFFINWTCSNLGWGEIGQSITAQLDGRYQFYLWIEGLLILLLVVSGLRRHSGAAIDSQTKTKKLALAGVLILLAGGWAYAIWKFESLNIGIFQIIGILIFLLIAYSILWQTFGSETYQGRERKNIVVCFDGTWNQPGQRDFGYLSETNVFKLYKMLKGKRSRQKYNASRSKEYLTDGKRAKQVAFYYHGVGNKVENSQLGQLFGGAFGMGADAIVERAYLDVVRVYRPGDRIFIFGFSRGAAIARLFAGVVGRRGVPISIWTLRLLGLHWTVWKSSKKLVHPQTKVRTEKGLSSDDVLIEVLGCWDTVGSFGISKNLLGIPFQKINLLKDLSVSLSVKRAYHMVALDETRDAFEPTLMDPDPVSPERIIEVWFSGNHANIGGGYATDRLSNVTLDFLLRHVSSGYAWNGSEPGDESWGLYLDAARKGHGVNGTGKEIAVIDPDPRGRIRHSTGAAYSHFPRTLPIHAIIFDSVFDRMRDVLPVYAPQGLFNLNDDLVKKRAEIETEVTRLAETHSLDDEECTRIRAWSNEKLTLTKWSEYLDFEVEGQTRVKETLKPAKELANPPMLEPAGG